MKSKFWVGLLAIAIASGCATKAPQPEPASSVGNAGAPSAASLASPMGVPPASTKRLVLHMTGPDFVTHAKDWPAFQEEWRATFADYAKQAAIQFDVQKGDAPATGDAGTLVDVYVNDYRMVGIGSRVFFSAMTGNAYIDAKATYSGLGDGAKYGERAYNTTSTAWAGMFAKMTPQQVDQIAAKVFAELGAPPYK